MSDTPTPRTDKPYLLFMGGDYKGDPMEAYCEMVETARTLEGENAELRKEVEKAWQEGYNNALGKTVRASISVETCWLESHARKVVEGEVC